MSENGGDFSFSNGSKATAAAGALLAKKSLPMIQTHPKGENGICHDDSAAPVKALTLDELHSLQKKRSTPTTPVNGAQGPFAHPASDDGRQKQQLQSIRFSNTLKLYQLTRFIVFVDNAPRFFFIFVTLLL